MSGAFFFFLNHNRAIRISDVVFRSGSLRPERERCVCGEIQMTRNPTIVRAAHPRGPERSIGFSVVDSRGKCRIVPDRERSPVPARGARATRHFYAFILKESENEARRSHPITFEIGLGFPGLFPRFSGSGGPGAPTGEIPFCVRGSRPRKKFPFSLLKF